VRCSTWGISLSPLGNLPGFFCIGVFEFFLNRDRFRDAVAGFPEKRWSAVLARSLMDSAMLLQTNRSTPNAGKPFFANFAALLSVLVRPRAFSGKDREDELRNSKRL